MPTFKEIYNEPLKRAREERKQLIERLSKATNASKNTVDHWLAGTRFPSVNARLLAGIAFNCDPDELFPPKDDDANGDNNPTDEQAKPRREETTNA